MSNSIVMGVDIGGSHITAALVDLDTRKVIQHSWIRKSVDSHEDASRIISSWGEAIKKAFSALEFEITKVGIGMPGPFDYENGICFIKDQDKYESLYGLNIKELLAEALEVNPDKIRLMNDAACFLQGEAFGGAAKGFSKIIGLTLGTGLGSSIYSQNTAVDANFWNLPFKDSIAEDYLSTRWFIKRYRELSGKVVTDVKYLAKLAISDNDALTVFNEFGTNLGAFLNEFIELEKPEAIVLGGNISNAFNLFEKALRSSINTNFQHIPIFQAKLGEEAALIGASSLWYFSSFETVSD
ncbi:ROK family protein [Desertivirga xinjiangensis]|uniref:ROK family protein n=1 Tax=Desertivirga xinjiangensis TaxID=539206 RepID=UPI00210E423D|nr:ROK family protein [Pedobacter xinjiangensis]